MAKAYSHKAMMAQLHIAPKELGMDEDMRRDFIAANCGGKRSSIDLTFSEKFKLLQAFKDAGWKPKKRNIKKKHQYKLSTSRKMIALWRELYFLGVVRDNRHDALEAWIANQVNLKSQQIPRRRSPDTLNVSEINTLIEQLKQWIDRVDN